MGCPLTDTTLPDPSLPSHPRPKQPPASVTDGEDEKARKERREVIRIKRREGEKRRDMKKKNREEMREEIRIMRRGKKEKEIGMGRREKGERRGGESTIHYEAR